MEINKIKNSFKLNFGHKGKPETELNHNVSSQKAENYAKVTSIPSNLVNANIPIKYTKINEFTLPETETKVYLYKLSNGQTVVLAPKKGETQINTYVNCGSMNEKESIRGISHFIEHNLFNGSKNIKPNELFNLVNKMGAYTNAWTSEFATSYMIKSQLFDSDDLKKIIELHCDMIQNPRFEQSQLDKEKRIVNSEITMYDDDNSRILYGKAVKQLLNIDSNSNDIVGGTVKNINNLSREDIINYYNKNYTPDKMITVLTGDFEPDKTIELISKNITKAAVAYQSEQNHEKFSPIETSKRIDYVSHNIKNDEIALAFVGPKNNNLKDIICSKIINDILSGSKYCELDKELKRYNVSPSCSIDKIGNKVDSSQVITMFASSNPKDTENVLKTIYKTIHHLQNKDLKEDIGIAKKNLLIGLGNIFESGNGINMFLGSYLSSHSPSEIEKIPDIINSLTEIDIKSALNKYYDLNKVSLVVAHPKDLDISDDPPPPGNLKTHVGFKGASFKAKLEKKGLDLNKFRYVKLQNNANVFLTDDKSSLKHFALSLNTKIPADVNPLTPLILEKIFSYGSRFSSAEEFSKDLAKHGANFVIKAEPFGLIISANSLNDDINYILSKTIEILNSPKFDNKTFEEIKKQIAKDIKESKKSPFNYIQPVMFPHLQSLPTKEDKMRALNKITIGEILGFLEYLKKNSTLNFVWNKNEIPNELLKLGDFKVSDDTKFLTYKPLEKDILKVQTENNGQAKIVQAYKYKAENTPKEIAKIAILNEILGGGQASRLFTDLRETKKLAYSTNSQNQTLGDTGIMTLFIGTTTDNSQDATATSKNITKSLEGFKNNIEKLKNEHVSDFELESAKLSLKSAILGQLETKLDKSFGILGNFIDHNDSDFSNKILSEIDKITVEDVQNAAKKVFEGHSLTSIVASEKTLNELNLHP